MHNQAIKLSLLLGKLEETIADEFYGNSFWIIAETSDVKIYEQKGWCFLKLIEKSGNITVAKVDSVIWKNSIIKKFEETTLKRFDKGMELLLLVSIEYKAAYGLSLQIHQIDESFTLGNIEKNRIKVMETLVKRLPEKVWWQDGILHSANHQKKLPLVIKKIALVSGKDSDGLKDFLHEIENNKYGYKFEITIFETFVQGKFAADSFQKTFKKIEEHKSEFDAVVVCRGGGSALDLEVFDDFYVAASIATCSIAVITGIGHTKNISIADMLAYRTLKTPTKAADFVIEHNFYFEMELNSLKIKLANGTKNFVQHKLFQLQKIKMDFRNSTERLLIKNQNLLNSWKTILKLSHPNEILKKGFVMVYQHKKVVTSKQKLKGGELKLKFIDGEIDVKN
jgi:exodeoxyribonuclease VII large subunit